MHHGVGMKTLAVLGLGLLLLYVQGKGLAVQTKKYDIKSGIINFETTTKAGSVTVTRKHVVYFDDFGKKECREEYDGDTLKESYFSDGKNLYKVIHAERTAYRTGKAVRGTEFRYDWNEVPESHKREGDAKKLANMIIAGKNCESFQQSDSGTTTKFAGWNHICLFTEQTSRGMNSVSKAVKIEENVSVPAEKFKVPDGFRIK